jgi:hypothetical protein
LGRTRYDANWDDSGLTDLIDPTGRAMTVLLKLAALGGLLLALVSVYPGVLVDLIVIGIFLSPLLLLAMGIGGVAVLLWRARLAWKPAEPELLADDVVGGGKESVFRWYWSNLPPAIVILSLFLMVSGAPRRAAFFLSRPAFQRHVAMAPASESEHAALGRFLGIYYVDRYGADPRGGVYFRTHAGADGIGPDTMSYGFAYKPNAKGTPFGNSHYRVSHIVGDWYVFSASNDW